MVVLFITGSVSTPKYTMRKYKVYEKLVMSWLRRKIYVEVRCMMKSIVTSMEKGLDVENGWRFNYKDDGRTGSYVEEERSH